ncbi:MAG TPA: XrtA/PEP-CTERM system TPR-repeat protein PrsT, partial [Alphaproteobacteria bacterium]|nr:XrtA/PEP-CTERM system TPR-repeat protein PrsT [Alphaproteobacteria bacterium]
GLLKVAPNSPQINYLRAAAAFEEQAYVDAQRYADAALAVDDSHGPSLRIAGTAAYALGRLEQANERLSRLVSYDHGNLPARKLLGAVKLRLGRDVEAVETLSVAVESGSADAELLTLAGTAALRTGDRTAASQYFEQASAEPTADPNLRARLALASVSTGGPDQGAQDLTLTGRDGDEQSQLQAGAALIQQGRIDEALQLAHDLQARNPSGVGGYLLEGAAHAARQDAPAAITAFEAGRELAPDNPAVLGNLGEAYRLGGELAKAAETLDKARALAPDDLSILQRQLRLADALQDAETFEKLLQEWIALKPRAVDPRRVLARTQLLSNRAEEAFDTLQPVLPEAGDDPLVHEVAGRALQMMGRPADAVEHFEAILASRPEDPNAAALVAEARDAAGDMPGAVEARRRAVSLAPDDQGLRIGLIGTLIAAGEPEAVGEEIAALEAITGKTATTEHWRGVAALETGEDETALEHFREALALRPATEEAVTLAKSQWRLDRRDAALETLDRWLAANPEDVAARRQRAVYLLDAGRYDSARQDYEALAEGDPENPAILNNLAWLLSRDGKLDEAAAYAERALALAPENPAIMDTVGGILSEQGEHDRAIALLSQASEAAPDSPDIRLHHLEALLRAGRRDVATEILNDLRAQFPDSQLVSDAETLLEE